MNKYNPNNILKFYEKDGLTYASFPAFDKKNEFKWEAWGKDSEEARKNLFRFLIDNKL